MGIILHEQEGCSFCKRVIDRLSELEVDYKSVPVPRRHSERTEVKTLSGQRQVPLLVDEENGVTMSESGRILEYLDANYADA